MKAWAEHSGIVFPARAGMILIIAQSYVWANCIPRESGDDPSRSVLLRA